MAGALQPRNGSLQKPRNTSRTLSMLGQYMLHSAPLLILALVLSIVGNVFQLIGPALCGRAIDAASRGKGQVDFQTVYYYALQMIVFYVASAALAYLVPQIVLRISQRTVRLMRGDLFYKLMRLPVKYFDTHQIGELLSRISYDIDTVNTSLSNDLVQILTSIITIVGALVMMIKISPLLVLVFVVTVPLSVLFTRFMTSRVRPLYHNRSKCLGALNGFAEEYISGQKTIRAYHREEDALTRFDEKNEDAVNSYYKAEYYASSTGPSVNFINNLSLTLISIFGALMYLNGAITLGNISSFVLYSRKFSGPINEAANIFSELQSALAAAERVFELLNEEEETADVQGAFPLQVEKGEVDLKHVDFGYDSEKMILKNINLTAEPGNMIAIVGPTGAGKTTIVNLLMRFYDPKVGERSLIDGQSIYQVTRKIRRGSFSMVLQDTWLFNGTIHDNIAYGNPDATREAVIAAAKAAHIHGMIMRLPHGYDTVITEDGVNISKGQKQLLTIARAMLQPAHLLILDEATSNVDLQTEMLIQEAMRTLMRDKTCFVIAHRLSTIRNANLILVVNEGRIVEQGTHKTLMEKMDFMHPYTGHN